MNPYSKYQKVDISTADNKKIIVLLYEGAIKFLNLAIQNIEKKEYDAKVYYVNKALAIILHLSTSLDFEKGGEIAENLDRLYNFVRDNTTAGSLQNDSDKIKKSIDILRTLLEGWQGILDKQKEPEIAKEVNVSDINLTRLFAEAS